MNLANINKFLSFLVVVAITTLLFVVITKVVFDSISASQIGMNQTSVDYKEIHILLADGRNITCIEHVGIVSAGRTLSCDWGD